MAKMPDNFIDLTVTSPPYDNLREYKGYSFDFESIAKELFRVTKQGGIVVWVVGDATESGSESGTSFKQALYFKEIGFNLHDTMIYNRSGKFPEANRYWQDFEYMFVFSKGKPNTFNPIKYKSVREEGEKVLARKRTKEGELIEDTCHKKKTQFKGEKNGGNIWYIPAGWMTSSKDEIAYNHPAIFPEQLAQDHIISWSNPNDLIYDPFTGSGTTAKMAVKLGRNWLGSEISSEYCEIANKRVSDAIKLTGTPDPTKAIHGQQINLF
jgi:site-specific DNA-methyltransferase (adenine-specific)